MPKIDKSLLMLSISTFMSEKDMYVRAEPKLREVEIYCKNYLEHLAPNATIKDIIEVLNEAEAG